MNQRMLVIATAAIGVAVLGSVLLRHAESHAANPPERTTATAPPPKQLWHCGMHPQVIRDHPGDCPICHMALTPLAGDSGGDTSGREKRVLYWWDPMLGASSITDHPGKSAMGMDLVPVYAQSAGPDVRIDPAVVQNMGVRTAEVTRGTLDRRVRTVGLLTLPEPGLHDVSLRVGGWIDKLYADQEGMHVTQGQPLFEVYSPELQVASQELISATKALRALKETAGDVVKQEARNITDAARSKLRLLGVDDADIDAIANASAPPRDVVFRSPVTGHVEEKTVVQGASVQPGMKLLRIADHTTMWLDLQVYADDLPFVKVGQRVNATVDGIPGKTFAGTVTFAYPHVDPMSRTLKVRVTLPNPDFELKPGMYATAEIAAEPVGDVVLAPREAVIDTGTRQVAFVAREAGHFTARKVRIGLSGDDDQVQVVEGLTPGERVVTSGQFLMDVESRTIEATQKLSER